MSGYNDLENSFLLSVSLCDVIQMNYGKIIPVLKKQKFG